MVQNTEQKGSKGSLTIFLHLDLRCSKEGEQKGAYPLMHDQWNSELFLSELLTDPETGERMLSTIDSSHSERQWSAAIIWLPDRSNWKAWTWPEQLYSSLRKMFLLLFSFRKSDLQIKRKVPFSNKQLQFLASSKRKGQFGRRYSCRMQLSCQWSCWSDTAPRGTLHRNIIMKFSKKISWHIFSKN